MKLYSFISRLQKLNACLAEFPSDTEGRETEPLPADKIMDIVYHSMSTTWEKKMIEQSFNYIDLTIKEMTDIFGTRVENVEPKEHKKRRTRNPPRIEKGMTPTQVIQSPLKNLRLKIVKLKNTASYMGNAVILWIIVMIRRRQNIEKIQKTFKSYRKILKS